MPKQRSTSREQCVGDAEWRQVFRDRDFLQAFTRACRRAFKDAATEYEGIKRRKRAAARQAARLRNDPSTKDLLAVLDAIDRRH